MLMRLFVLICFFISSFKYNMSKYNFVVYKNLFTSDIVK